MPRTFLLGIDPEAGAFELPKAEYEKLTRVLRLQSGAELAILPNDGTLIRCVLKGHHAFSIERVRIEAEHSINLTLAQALPRTDKLEEVVRMGTEIGIDRFLLFPSARTVVRWDAEKLDTRLKRLRMIAVEAAEVCFRARLPLIESCSGLEAALQREPNAIVLSEVENVKDTLAHRIGSLTGTAVTLMIGPEGGWSPAEVELIGPRAVTLGRLVLRVDTAAASAAAVAMAILAENLGQGTL